MTDTLLKAYHCLPAPLRSVAASLRGLYLSYWRYGSETERLIEEALDRGRWTPGRWKAWHEERLAYVLHRAATRVPYYRKLWAARTGDRSTLAGGLETCQCGRTLPVIESVDGRTDDVLYTMDGRRSSKSSTGNGIFPTYIGSSPIELCNCKGSISVMNIHSLRQLLGGEDRSNDR